MINNLTELYNSIMTIDNSYYRNDTTKRFGISQCPTSGPYVYNNGVSIGEFSPYISIELYKLLINKFKYFNANIAIFNLHDLIVVMRSNKLDKI